MSASRGLWAVVPVKRFAQTKRRLMPQLASHEREALARAMLADVLFALVRTQSLAGIMVITGDADAAAMVHAAGAFVVADAENAGTAAAVTQAARHLAAAGRDGMLMIPADVPLITPADVEMIVAAHRAAPSVTLVPASIDAGTNALACSPPSLSRFVLATTAFAGTGKRRGPVESSRRSCNSRTSGMTSTGPMISPLFYCARRQRKATRI